MFAIVKSGIVVGSADYQPDPADLATRNEVAVEADGFSVGDQYDGVDFTPSAAQVAPAADPKWVGVEFAGVMCSATSEDMWGLAALRPHILAGASFPFYFSNGSVLVLTPDNVAAFEAVWIPFRASFFEVPAI